VTNSSFDVLLSFEGRDGAFGDVLCFDYEALFSQHGIVHRQKHCQTYQVLSLDGSLGSSISSLTPLPPNGLGWILALDLLNTFHLDLSQPRLYMHIPFIIRLEV
jgi:hypothetical protein